MTFRGNGHWPINLGDATIYLTVVVLLAVNTALQPNFIQVSNLLYVLGTALPLVFAAAAQGLVMLTSSIDLAAGSIISLTNVLVVVFIGQGSVVAIGLAIAAGVVVGTLAGLLTTLLRLPSIIVTLALSSIWAGLALYILPTPRSGLPASLGQLTTGSTPLWVTLALVGAWLWLARTPLGKRIYALGSSENAAYMAGISILRTKLIVFAISGGLLALAAIMLSATTGGGDPLSGAPITLQTIAAAVLGGISFRGGKGSLVGAVAGAIVLALITNVVFYTGASAFYQGVVYGVLLVLALALSRFTSHRWVRVPRPSFTRSIG
ncbi:MAG TPA: ABC transporter permease [Streptosporangiaceae bacterium]|jgi:ribose transport system permease protein|nr:ABC transporter permease [Streptosporangiaceae bacterium]